MLKSELLNLINTMEDTENVDSILKETDLYKSSLTLDSFKNLVSTNKDFIGFMDSEKDKHSTISNKTAIENFKANGMKTIIDAEVLKKTGGKAKTPLELEVEEIRAEMAKDKKELAAAKRLNKYKDVLNEKGLNDFADNILRFDDEEAIETEIENFTTKFETIVNKRIEAKIKGSGYVPPKGAVETGMTKEKFLKLNLGEQAKLATEDKDLYAKLTE